MRFERVGGVIRSQVRAGDWHNGWEGVTHGGIIASILDEAMAYSLFFEGIQGLTGRMEVRYRTPSYPGDLLTVESSIVRDARRIADVNGSIRCDGRVIAESTGRFMKAGALTLEVLTEHTSRSIPGITPPLPHAGEGVGG
jgi:acyl-coenzyme A thioesterase PaaI-like protein